MDTSDMDTRDMGTRVGVALLILARQCMGRLGQGLDRMLRAVRLPALRPATDRSRGDVPGWVLITLMSAVLVAGLLAIAGPALERLFNQAMEQVKP